MEHATTEKKGDRRRQRAVDRVAVPRSTTNASAHVAQRTHRISRLPGGRVGPAHPMSGRSDKLGAVPVGGKSARRWLIFSCPNTPLT